MIGRLSPLVLVALLLIQGALAPAAVAAPGAVPYSGPPDAAFDLKRPPAPTGSYRPRFVRQTQNNCAFASAAMLIDKWTGGHKRPAQSRMRAASGVPTTEGVGVSQLARAVQKVTRLKMLWSPNGGDPLTWEGLLGRLAKGGGAVIAGAYSRLPSHYQRWNRAYAALGPADSGHALYIERYESGRRGGRVWMMDPLGAGSRYAGEWIAANDLKVFAWHNARGLVHAVATPEPPPLAGYEFGDPQVVHPEAALAGREVTLSIPLRTRAGWGKPDGLALSVVWHPQALEPDPEEVAAAYIADVAAARAAAALDARPKAAPKADARDPVPTTEAADGEPQLDPADDISAADLASWRATRDAVMAAEAVEAAEAADTEAAAEEDELPAGAPLKRTKPVLVPLVARGDRLIATVAAPKAAGEYRLTTQLRRRGGAEFPESQAPALADLTVVLRGPLLAEYGPPKLPDELVQGAVSTIVVTVANLGGRDWRGENKARLVARWDTVNGSWHAGSTKVALSSLERRRFALDVIAPNDVLQGTLAIELLTADGVPMSEYGAQPLAVEVEFDEPADVSSATGAAQE